MCAALCAAAAAVLAVTGTGGAAASDGAPVVVAARDIRAGTALTAADLGTARWPEGIRPPGAPESVEEVIGKTAGAAIGRGEAITSARLLGASALARPASGFVAALVPAGPAAAVLQPGDRVDIYAARQSFDGIDAFDGGGSLDGGGEGGLAALVAADALVLSITAPAGAGGASPSGGGGVVVQVDDATAARLAGAVDATLTVVARAPR